MRFGRSLGTFTSMVRLDLAHTAEASPDYEIALLEAVREAKVLPANLRSLTERGLSSGGCFFSIEPIERRRRPDRV